MKIIFGYRERKLKQLKSSWDFYSTTINYKNVDKDKLINKMEHITDKIFLLLEMD